MGARWISWLATPHDRTLRDTENQKLPALTIVVHITGRATYINAEKRGIPPLQHLGEYFDQARHPFAHYSIDPLRQQNTAFNSSGKSLYVPSCQLVRIPEQTEPPFRRKPNPDSGANRTP